MCHRGPAAVPGFIVNPNKILTIQQVINEKYSIMTLVRSMPDSRTYIQWFARRGLIKKKNIIRQMCHVD